MDQPKFDLSVFKDTTTIPCKYGNYKKCISVRRLLVTLRYYESSTEVNQQDLFSNFMMDVYKNQILDDYHHLIKHHSEHTNDIHQYFLKQMSGNMCNVNSCEFASRHHRVNEADNGVANESESTINMLFQELMDSLHIYIHHLYQYGLRTVDAEMDDEKNSASNHHDSPNFDVEFHRVNNVISKTKKNTKSFVRFGGNAQKYNIIANEKQVTSKTYLDTIFAHLKASKVNDIVLDMLKFIVEEEEYDTDALAMYVDIRGENPNLEHQVMDKECVTLIASIIKTARLSSSSFNIGFRFYYWDGYKKIREIPPEIISPDHGKYDAHAGFDVCELFIRRKYGSFKEELRNYGYEFGWVIQCDFVITKASQYMECEAVKMIYATILETPPYYGIEAGSSLNMEHLMAIICYTDYTKHSASFTRSFRKTDEFEGLESVKKRNAEYFWMAKSLREVTEIYGKCSYTRYIKAQATFNLLHASEDDSQLTGPFYTGMNIVMTMPQFNIRLCSPTSTTLHIEIAMKFSGEGGMILMLNNPAFNLRCRFSRAFDVSLISRYKEEDEILCFGGHWPMNVESIWLVSDAQKFGKITKGITLLDSLLSGSGMVPMTGAVVLISSKINAEQVSSFMALKNIFDHFLGKKPKKKYHDYIYEAFKCFVHNKTDVYLKYSYLATYGANVLNLFMYQMHIRQNAYLRRDDLTNLFRPELLRILINTKSMTLETGGHTISLLGLLSLIENSKIEKISVTGNWVRNLPANGVIEQKYNQTRYNITTQWPRNSDTRRYRYIIAKGSRHEFYYNLALATLSNIITGGRETWITIETERQTAILKPLFHSSSARMEDSEFQSFIHHTTSIELHLTHLSMYNKEITNLFIYSLQPKIRARNDGDYNNLFRPELLKMFTNVTKITIDTVGNYEQYNFSLLSLLSLMKVTGLKQVLIIGGGWVGLEAWNSFKWIMARYNQAKYTVTVKAVGQNYIRNHCLIEKQG